MHLSQLAWGNASMYSTCTERDYFVKTNVEKLTIWSMKGTARSSALCNRAQWSRNPIQDKWKQKPLKTSRSAVGSSVSLVLRWMMQQNQSFWTLYIAFERFHVGTGNERWLRISFLWTTLFKMLGMLAYYTRKVLFGMLWGAIKLWRNCSTHFPRILRLNYIAAYMLWVKMYTTTERSLGMNGVRI